jgi:hypothetical protein
VRLGGKAQLAWKTVQGNGGARAFTSGRGRRLQGAWRGMLSHANELRVKRNILSEKKAKQRLPATSLQSGKIAPSKTFPGNPPPTRRAHPASGGESRQSPEHWHRALGTVHVSSHRSTDAHLPSARKLLSRLSSIPEVFLLLRLYKERTCCWTHGTPAGHGLAAASRESRRDARGACGRGKCRYGRDSGHVVAGQAGTRSREGARCTRCSVRVREESAS